MSGEFLRNVSRQLDRDLALLRRRQIHVDKKLGQSRQAGIFHDGQIVRDRAAQERADGEIGFRLKAESLRRECESSLKRLRLDAIDLYQIHWPNTRVPIKETMQAMETLVDRGQVRYIGVSTFAAWQIVESLWVSEKLGLNRFVTEQPPFNSVCTRKQSAPIMRALDGAGFKIVEKQSWLSSVGHDYGLGDLIDPSSLPTVIARKQRWPRVESGDVAATDAVAARVAAIVTSGRDTPGCRRVTVAIVVIVVPRGGGGGDCGCEHFISVH